ncbi:MAG: hypothetical protein GF331_07055 [Chitinivibrionales bacterium]|nr:hypothetical protein [Chitinivibrionales bacterium]
MIQALLRGGGNSAWGAKEYMGEPRTSDRAHKLRALEDHLIARGEWDGNPCQFTAVDARECGLRVYQPRRHAAGRTQLFDALGRLLYIRGASDGARSASPRSSGFYIRRQGDAVRPMILGVNRR